MLTAIIISDTHANKITELPTKIIEHIKTTDVSIHAGDIITQNFLDELTNISKKLYAVKGNNDITLNLPEKLIFNLENIKIALSHGTGNKENIIDRLAYTFHDAKPNIIIFGHTHHLLNIKIDDTLYINPGNAISSKRAPSSFIKLVIDGDSYNVTAEFC